MEKRLSDRNYTDLLYCFLHWLKKAHGIQKELEEIQPVNISINDDRLSSLVMHGLSGDRKASQSTYDNKNTVQYQNTSTFKIRIVRSKNRIIKMNVS